MVYWSHHKIKEGQEHGDDFGGIGGKLKFEEEFWSETRGGKDFWSLNEELRQKEEEHRGN